MSRRGRRGRRTPFEAKRAEDVAVAALRQLARGRKFQLVFHGWRSWGWGMGGPWPSARRPLFAWCARVGPVEVRRWAA